MKWICPKCLRDSKEFVCDAKCDCIVLGNRDGFIIDSTDYDDFKLSDVKHCTKCNSEILANEDIEIMPIYIGFNKEEKHTKTKHIEVEMQSEIFDDFKNCCEYKEVYMIVFRGTDYPVINKVFGDFDRAAKVANSIRNE